MAALVPKFIVMTQNGSDEDKPAYYRQDGSVVYGAQENVFSPLAKIEVETATTNSNYVHLRFCCSNRYLHMKSATDKSIVAVSKEPDEDTSESSCTLFEPMKTSEAPDVFLLIHVNTRGALRLTSNFAVVEDSHGYTVKLLNWDTFVKLPQHVAFKGDNNKYLRARRHNNGRHLLFEADDPNDVQSGHQVQLMADGHVRIFSDSYQGYWWNDYDWIWGDWSAGSGQRTSLFWPIRIDDNTIALRSVANNSFCNRRDESVHALGATAATMTTQARFQVHELVGNRKIYDVTYRMSDARIYNQIPYVAGTATVVNDSEFESSESVSITFQDAKSYSFSRGFALKAGVKTTIETNLLFIVKGEVEVSFEISGNFEWNTTTTTTTTVTATGSVMVPPKSSATVDYIGTRGLCNVPYSYTQEDQSSTDGTINRIVHTDGTYIGVSNYNFSFHVTSTRSL